jgi:PAS domain-containing protein
MKLQESWAGSTPLHELLNQLSDAILLLDRLGTLRFANSAALRLLSCEPGTPLVGLQAVIGEAAVAWLQQALTNESTAPTPIPDVLIARGRRARLSWRLLDDQYGALTVLVSAEAKADS